MHDRTPLPTFSAFFQDLWGYDPFPWQTMLAERVADGRWPQAIDLPTAAGKTACIDAAVYALAAQADIPAVERTAARRIWFVVDRRIVVDEAVERASIIAEKLEKATDGPLREIAARLLRLSGTNRPLAVARLRGGILRDDNWGRLPSQPAVIASTVDQLGSRLLFRGYGRSALTASIFAGLAAHDSLILLDEAHCSVPFMQTLRAIEIFRGKAWAETPLVTPFAFAILSATPPAGLPKAAIFPGTEREHALDHPILRRRLSASKPAELTVVKARTHDADPLVAEAASRALFYRADGGKRRIAVIVNRVHTAKEIANVLHQEDEEATDIVLLTGRLRPYERDRLVGSWKPFLKANSPSDVDRPIILVSTQCIEVGADFSFDALVTEAASLDALRQRFGRLNRMGQGGPAPATILLRRNDAKAEQTDPIYGQAISACWSLLNEKAIDATSGKGTAKSIDFGFDALDRILSDVEDLSPCLALSPEAPILLPGHLDLLCQTAPTPHVDPDIGQFLHGKERGTLEARVIWRTDLSVDNTGIWKESVALCPPVNGEMLAVPLRHLRTWLAKKAMSDEGTSDVEGTANDAGTSVVYVTGGSRPFLLWRGRDRSEVCDDPGKIRANDVVLVPAAYQVMDLGQSEPFETLGGEKLDLWEFARLASGKPAAMRINSTVLEPWCECPPLKDLIGLAEDPAREPEALHEALEAVLNYDPGAEGGTHGLPQWLCDLLKAVRVSRVEDHPGGGVVLFARKLDLDVEPDLFADDDDLMTAIGNEAVSLARHSQSVERAVDAIASRCLPPQLLHPLVRAAYWHDVGKLDERFQYVLRQGADVHSAPLAKSASMPVSPERRDAIRAVAGLPKGFRHEMLSAQLTERFADLRDDEEDLILHLVASHHGYARPFAPIALDHEPPAVSGHHDGVVINLSATERAELIEPHSVRSDIGERFWLLTRRYGWWGLAYLEAVLRLGDWYGSIRALRDEPVALAEQPQQSRAARTTTVTATPSSIVLNGLDGANPLGFLAALGTLLALRGNSQPQARLEWRRAATWQPVLTGVSSNDKDMLCHAIATVLSGRAVPKEAEAHRIATQKNFDDAKKALKDKRNEIKGRRLQKRERVIAIEAELTPLEWEMQQKRDIWLNALKGSVPSPELALGKRIDCTSDEFRDYAASFLKEGRVSGREQLALLAAFGSDAHLDRSGRVAATPFCFITGSGQQFFLDTARQLMTKATAERVRSTLFEPWGYGDETLSMRWDPIEDRRHALMDRNPTASDNKSRTVWMANLLAYRALVLFLSAPGQRGLETTGWGPSAESFTWPLWEHAADPDTIRSLLLLPDLNAGHQDRSLVRARGVTAVFRSRRVRVGSGSNIKINFSPARGV